MTIAADPKHLGARIGITAVLHTWGSTMTHHPHIHMIVPGGGISLDAQRWISSRPAFLLPVRVLGALFRRLFLTQLIELYQAGRLAFFGTQAGLADRRLFLRRLAAVRKKRFVVYAKPPFAGPEAVLAYLARYTHRVAISNRRLIAFDETGVTFRYKDYRRDGAERQRVMTLAPHEFIRRFLLHVLPRGFHRIRHYGLLASSARKASIARARELLGVVPPPEPVELPEPLVLRLQTIVSREVAANDAAVVTVGVLQAGTKENVIPDEAVIKLNVRTFDAGVREHVLGAIERIVNAEAEASGAPRKPEITPLDRYPLNVNDETASNRIAEAFRGYFPPDRVKHTGPAPASEDFGCFGTAWQVPSVFWFVGGNDPEIYATARAAGKLNELPVNHSPQFAPVLHPTLETGVEALVVGAMAWLGAS